MLQRITLLNAENEWAFLKAEMDNKPASAPYSQRFVQAREILLKLQVLLSAYQNETEAEQRQHFAEKYSATKQAYLQLAYARRK
jgi:hypothetical protein